MVDEKDRLGDKLRKKEKAEEDRFFSEREKAAVERLRAQRAGAQQEELRKATHMRCPRCGEQLVSVEHSGVRMDECPGCQGVWLDRGELDTIAQRARDSWLGRLLLGPRR
jgi:hypothetical protein